MAQGRVPSPISSMDIKHLEHDRLNISELHIKISLILAIRK